MELIKAMCPRAMEVIKEPLAVITHRMEAVVTVAVVDQVEVDQEVAVQVATVAVEEVAVEEVEVEDPMDLRTTWEFPMVRIPSHSP